MKNLGWVFLILLSLSSPRIWAQDDKSSYFTKRIVEIEWDEVPYATEYQLQIYDGRTKKFIKTFTSTTNLFKLNVKMGKYFFRSRIRDRFERTSEWTDLAELIIAPPPTRITTPLPLDVENFADKKTGVFNLPVGWAPLPGIEDYKVLLISPTGTSVAEWPVKATSLDLKIPPGQYQIKVQAILADGTLGDPSEPTGVLSVVGAKIQPPTLEFQRKMGSEQFLEWSSEMRQALYDGEIFYKAHEGTDWIKVKDLVSMVDKKLDMMTNYKPGLYRVSLRAKAPGFTPSDATQIEFVVKPTVSVLEDVIPGRHFFDENY